MSKTNHRSLVIKFGLIAGWIIMALSILVPANQIHAVTILVTNANDSGAGSLRQAITNAISGDTIKFSPSLSGQTILLASQLDITKNLVIDGSGLIPRVSISGNNAVRIFNVNSNRIFTLKSLILKDGKTTGTSYTTFGGALFVNNNTTLSVDNTLFTNNTAYSAGAIYLSPSVTASITNSEITGNEANTEGGAIRINGIGAINLKNNIISDNVSGGAGAIYFYSGAQNSIIENNVFENNYAIAGGAIAGEMPVSTLEIRNNLFIGNQATGSYQAGGAVYFTAHTIPSLIILENNTFYNNAATWNGGGAYLGMGPTYYLINNTFSNNMATTGGNLYLDHGTSLPRMYNNIIANHTGGGDCTAFSNTYINGSNNLIEDGSVNCLPNLTGDPGLLPLLHNGGATQTMALSSNSTAIDAGNNSFCTTIDQRGTPRPQGTACDLGAVELDETSPNLISSEPNDGEVLIADTPIELKITFNEPMNQYSSEGTVYDPLNYLLINDNGDGFQTTSCLDGISAQDQFFTINEVAYNSTTLTASLKINDNYLLPAGNYQLFVCGTTPALTDIAGNSLNDGISDDIVSFRVIAISNNNVPENAPAGTSVFTLTAPNGSIFSYTLDENINGCNGTDITSFSFTSNQLLTTAVFDYEAQNTLAVCVVIDETGGNSFNQELSINVTDVNEPPIDIALSKTTITENTVITTQVGVIYTLDSDVYSTFIYDLADNVSGCNGVDNSFFSIVGNSLRTNWAFDYETKNNYTICIRSTDNGGFSIAKEFIISVLNTNDAPSNVILTPSSILEDQPGNTLVGYLIAIDPDGPTTTSFSSIPGTESCSSTGFNWFVLSNGNEVKTLAPLDYETASSYTLCIRATDSLGARLDKQITINVTNVSLPIVSNITRTDTNPTNAATVNFSITFSEAVTGVTGDDFDLNITGITGAIITNLSGSGNIYNVTVNTGSGNGTIRLDIPDTATITDLSSNGLTGIPFTSGETYTITKLPVATIDITIGGVNRGTYGIAPGSSQRVNYAGLDAGPVVVDATNDVPIIAALRDAYFVNGQVESFVQLMGLPEAALSTKYYFPAYNNVTLDGQLRFGNVGNASTTVTVTIAGVVRGTYNLAPGQAQRVNYTGLDAGPVIVESSGGVPIIAALRDAYFVNGQIESFAQLMGLPASQLSDTYYFPAYNNVTLNGQLRIGNVDTVPTTVTVTIAGVVRGTYPLDPNEAVRINYAGLDAGPVVVQSSGGAKIIAALRDAYFVNGQVTSFVQLMGLPLGQLSTKYYFPAYNNVTLDGQLRFGNVGNTNTTVTVTIGGVVRGTYNLAPGQAQRVNYVGLDAGPVIVESSGGVPIIAALRDAYFVNGLLESFAQLMGLPDAALSPTYYFPAYNNVSLDGQLRFGVP